MEKKKRTKTLFNVVYYIMDLEDDFPLSALKYLYCKTAEQVTRWLCSENSKSIGCRVVIVDMYTTEERVNA